MSRSLSTGLMEFLLLSMRASSTKKEKKLNEKKPLISSLGDIIHILESQKYTLPSTSLANQKVKGVLTYSSCLNKTKMKTNSNTSHLLQSQQQDS